MLLVIFYKYYLHNGVEYTWGWKIDPSKGYTVCGVYEILAKGNEIARFEVSTILWNKASPSNIVRVKAVAEPIITVLVLFYKFTLILNYMEICKQSNDN